MKESNNGLLNLNEPKGLYTLIRVAHELYEISDEIEILIRGDKFECEAYNNELSELVDNLRENAGALAPIIGNVAIVNTIVD